MLPSSSLLWGGRPAGLVISLNNMGSINSSAPVPGMLVCRLWLSLNSTQNEIANRTEAMTYDFRACKLALVLAPDHAPKSMDAWTRSVTPGAHPYFSTELSNGAGVCYTTLRAPVINAEN
jgi:hypothetical protein